MERNCPNCGKPVEIAGEGQFCPFCGTDLGDVAVPGEGEKHSPWDDRVRVGFFRGFVDTWVESVFHPTKFFAAMPVEGGYGGPLLYGFIVGEIGLLFGLFWEGLFMMMGALGERGQQLEAMGVSAAVLAMGALLSPLFVVIGYFLASGVLHLCLLLVGGARRDFEATFRVVCYAAGANLFNVLPLCGGLVAWLWNAVLNVIGIREAHEISSGKALLAYCLPALVCCGFLTLAFLFALPHITDWFEYQ